MSKRYAAAYLSLLATFLFLTIYNINLRNTTLVECSAAQSGNNAGLPEVAILQPSPAAQRWKMRMAASGNCTLQPVVPTWDNYFDMVVKHQKCARMKMFGGPRNSGKGDGAKNLCMDDALAPPRDACTVISVGINNDWSFDDAMAAWGCEVYSFDPTVASKDHLRGSRIHFHSLGLSGSRGTISSKKRLVPVDSYRGILKHVGLVNQTIDYLKIDIEGSEIPFFEDVLYHDTDALQYVKQLGVEIHVFRENVESRDKFWKIYNRLECLGFRKVYSEKNNYPGTNYVYKTMPVSCCYELVWINEAFL